MTQLSLYNLEYYEPLLISLKKKWLDAIISGQKRHEFRRAFFQRPSCAFVYVVAPHSVISHVVWLGEPIVAPPSQIAAIAERERPGGGRSILEYLGNRQVGFAIPVIGVDSIKPLMLSEIRSHFPSFMPPQHYVRLSRHPRLLQLVMEHAEGVVNRETFAPLKSSIA